MQAPLAILGGTFDPIHYGHLHVAEDIASSLALPEVRLFPAGDPPHRDPPSASAAHRVAMARLGVADSPRLSVDAREARQSGKSYTVRTLSALRAEAPSRPLALIVGADAFLGFPTWHRWLELFDLAHVIVVARPGIELQRELGSPLLEQWRARFSADPKVLRERPAGAIVEQRVTPNPISASAIRAELKRGEAGARAVAGLLPPAVLAYIRRKQLYGYHPDAPE